MQSFKKDVGSFPSISTFSFLALIKAKKERERMFETIPEEITGFWDCAAMDLLVEILLEREMVWMGFRVVETGDKFYI